MNSIPPLHDNNAPLPGSSPTAEYTDLHFAASSLPTGFTRFSEDSSASGTSKTKKNKRSPRSPRKKPTKASSSRSIKSNGSTSNTTNDDDRPKRPLSAYNIFFQHEREMIMQGRDPEDEWPGEHDEASNAIILKKVLARSKSSQPTGPKKKREHVRTHGKIGFVQLAKTVGAKWKKLDESSRSVYVALASLERKRYKKEMTAWEKQKAAEKKTTPQDIKLPNEVEAKKPASKIQQAQASHFARIMAGGASIFDCQDGEEGNGEDGYYYEEMPPLSSLPTPSAPTHVASYSTQCRQQYHHHHHHQQQQQHDEDQQQHNENQQLPPYPKINHSDLMERCRAELATYADTSLRSIGTEVSDLTHPEYEHSYPVARQPVPPVVQKAIPTTTTQEAAPTCWEPRHNDSASSIESLMSDFFDGPDSLDLVLDELEKADLPPPPSVPYKVDDTMHQTARRLSMLTVSAETATKTNNTTTTSTTTRRVSLATAVAAAQVEPNFYGGDYGGPSDADLLAFLSESKIGALEVDPSKLCKHGQDDLKNFLNWAFDEQDKSLCSDD